MTDNEYLKRSYIDHSIPEELFYGGSVNSAIRRFQEIKSKYSDKYSEIRFENDHDWIMFVGMVLETDNQYKSRLLEAKKNIVKAMDFRKSKDMNATDLEASIELVDKYLNELKC